MRRVHLFAVALAMAVAGPACGQTVDVFGGSGGGGDGGTSTTSSGTTSSGTTSSGTTSSGTTSSGTGGTTSTTSSGIGGASSSSSTSASSSSSGSSSSSSASSGQGGAPPGCEHDLCDTGASLDAACDPCVTQICGFDAFCCDNQWDALCVGHVWTTCNIDCAPGAPSCEDQYGQSSGYYLCIQGASSCEFGANVMNASCGSQCAQAGGECLEVFNNQDQCGHAQPLSCQQTGLQSVICVCSRGCGGGAPCGNGQQCFNGSCQ